MPTTFSHHNLLTRAVVQPTVRPTSNLRVHHVSSIRRRLNTPIRQHGSNQIKRTSLAIWAMSTEESSKDQISDSAVVPETTELDSTTKSTSRKNRKFGGGNLFDPAATISRYVTRRFGIVGGLGFVALLGSTELYEIVKTLLEQDSDGSGELVSLQSGLAYRDFKVGGGPMPRKGDFVGMSLVVKEGDEVLLDTRQTKRPIAFTYGKRPFVSVVCEGLEEGLSTMRRGGVREIIIPPELAYGNDTKVLPSTSKRVSPGATVVMTVTLEDVTGSYL